jgi:hypothetical protein
MSTYHPFFTGETTLRAETEATLCLEPGVVESRIAQLDESVQRAGKWVTWGSEIEYTMIDGPNANPDTTPTSDETYLEIIQAIQGDEPFGQYAKGQIINPRSHPLPIMVTEFSNGTWNPDQPDSDISEIRPAPTGALEAVDRYWTTINAIGSVAARHGQIALILGTHISAAVLDNYKQPGERFTQFMSDDGGTILAAAQHNLNTVSTLQLHAGLSRGIAIQEAFPYSKDGSTALFDKRLEIRHPKVAVVDPRVDMLAVLSAVQDVTKGEVPKSALANLREGFKIDVYEPANEGLAMGLELLTVWDPVEKRLVMPSQVSPTAHGGYSEALDNIVSEASGGAEPYWFADNGSALRSMLKSMQLDGMRLRPDAHHPWVKTMKQVFGRAVITLDKRVNRVLPIGTVDSPEMHAERRGNVTRSSAIRRIVGDASQNLTKAPDAIGRRRELFDTHMIELED